MLVLNTRSLANLAVNDNGQTMCYTCHAVVESGNIPPGNEPGETKWQSRVVRPKADIKLTAGKAINVPLETLIDQVVKANKVRQHMLCPSATCVTCHDRLA